MKSWARSMFLVTALLVLSLATARGDGGPGYTSGEVERIARLTGTNDQDWTLQCFLASSMYRLDFTASRKWERTHPGEGVKFSAKYIFYIKTKAEIEDIIINRKFNLQPGTIGEEQVRVKDYYYTPGGIFADVIETAREYGVMPEDAYPGFPRRDTQLYRSIHNLVSEFDAEARERFWDAQNQRWKAGKTWSRRATRNEKGERVESDIERIRRRVWETLEPTFKTKPPETFTWKGLKSPRDTEDFTPQEFFDLHLAEWKNVRLAELNYYPANAPTPKDSEPLAEGAFESTPNVFYGKPYDYLQTTEMDGNRSAKVLAVLKMILEGGESAMIQYKCVDGLRRSDRSYWDEGSKQTVTIRRGETDHSQQLGSIGFRIHDLERDSTFRWDDGMVLDHYVMAIGAEYARDGRIKKILIKNTWGLTAEENYGYHWLQPDYLDLIEAVELPVTNPALMRRIRNLLPVAQK